jgi:glutamate receptor, ionotropic, invertebrate
MQFENGSISMFTSDKKLSGFIKSTMKALDIPHIQTHLMNYHDGNQREEFIINIYPAQNMVNKAIHDVMKFLNWTRCALIHENNEGMIL